MPATTEGGAPTAFIQVDLNYEIIADLCRNIQLGTSGYVFIFGRQRRCRLSPPTTLIYGNLRGRSGFLTCSPFNGGYLRAVVDGREVLYTAAGSAQTGWTVVAVSYAG